MSTTNLIGTVTHVLLSLIVVSLATTTALGQAPLKGAGSFNISGPVRVIDGSTIETYINGKQVGLGMIGVDVPQGNTPCGKQVTSLLQAVTKLGFHVDEDLGLTFDSLGRRLYYHVSPAGDSLAAQLVLAGAAKPNGQGKEAATLKQLQSQAQATGIGCLWGGVVAIPQENEPAAPPPALATATVLPSGFTQSIVANNFVSPTQVAFLPDGRMLVAEKSGAVRLIKNGAVQSTYFIDIRDRVNDYWDHGLLGIAVDPNFTMNNYVYLLYTFEDNPTNYNATKTARLTRVTANGDVASPFSEVVLLGKTTGASCNNFPVGTDCLASDGVTHSIGTIRFATDGTIYLTVGDGANFNTVDQNAYRSQNLDLLAGKLLHIDNNGRGLASNPFWNGDPTANRSKVWSYGLRNPFRVGLRPGSNTPYLGDVGWETWEEVNVGTAGANLGWPCYEGNAQQAGYAPGPVCQALYAQGASAVKFGIVVYNHNGGGAASIGATFYSGSLYPAQYQGAYFHADYARNNIDYTTVDANNNLVSGPTAFASGADGPVDIEMGPDGNLYYIAIVTGELRKITYTLGNVPPTAVAGATPTNGLAPLSVQFSSVGTSDGDGDTLTYSWNFGDGSPASTLANPQHTYTAVGTYSAVLSVNDGHSHTSTATVPITVGRVAPTVTITSPLSSLSYKVGDVITFAGSGTDPVDGNLAASRLAWQIIIHHCPGNVCHTHPFLSPTGASGTFTVPDHGDNSFFELILTGTNSAGLAGTAAVQIHPRTVQITIQTVPSGLQVVYDGTSGPSPFVQTSIVNSAHTLYAPNQASVGQTYAFTSWSDAGAVQHGITVGTSNATYTANFTVSAASILIDAGSSVVYHASTGQNWAADTNFTGGQVYSVPNPISLTSTPELYQSSRWDPVSLQYQFNIPNGSYVITFKFAELFYTQAGQRVQNVTINGSPALTNFDIFAQAGGAFIALDRTAAVSVTNGQLTIQFTATRGEPLLNALDIEQLTGVLVTVNPAVASLTTNGTQPFTATVTGSSNTAVTWSLNPTVGTISSAGLYTAPATITGNQSVTVIATSVADPTRTGTARVDLSPPAGTFVPIRVNTGGTQYTDALGQVWSADTGFNGGNLYGVVTNILGTTAVPIYQDCRYNFGPLQYQFTVPNGTYVVNLKFAELFYNTAGSRVFNILVNGVTAFNAFDPFSAAGGPLTAIDKQTSVTVTGGQITILLNPVTGEPAINGIEILAQTSTVTVAPPSVTLSVNQTQTFTATGTATGSGVTWSISPNVGIISSAGLYTAPGTITINQTVTVTATSISDPTKKGTATINLSSSTFTPIRVNSGGSAFTDSAGNVWSADTGFNAGFAYATGATIAGTTSQALYQTVRWNDAPFTYTFNLPAGSFLINLKFAEVYYTAAGKRVFNVRVNGAASLTNFDPFQAAGGAFIAVDRQVSLTLASAGTVTIQFTPVTGEPDVNAIEIVGQ